MAFSYSRQMGVLLEEIRGIREENRQIVKAVKKIEQGSTGGTGS